ncbi:MAG: HAMP domain-containing sensor histidine kinase [Actinomycetaceae bacterium]|nr:HAMP domain-containing sensor histidine kinase [Actinomycetaceae bacterium]
MTRRVSISLALLPTVVASAVSLVWWLAGENRGLWAFLPLPTLVLSLGLTMSAVAFAVLLWRRALERAQAKGRAEAQEIYRLEHKQFLARLDHELKNPLTAILGAAASGGPDAPALVTAQARRMGVLITDLRKLGDMSSAPLMVEEVDLEEAARDAVEAARASTADGREFSLVFPTAPWPLPRVLGDTDLLYTAILNVVMNAVKYSDPGAHIEVRGSQVDTFVSIEVADTGIGVPEEDLGMIWSELARGSNVAGRAGSGLGLPFVHAIIERHGGSVRMTSRHGVGTSVTMYFPLPDVSGAVQG